MINQSQEVLVFVDRENRLRVQYYTRVDNKIVTEEKKIVSENLVEDIMKLYNEEVSEKSEFVHKMTVYVCYPYLYLNEIFKLGKEISNEEHVYGIEVNIEVIPLIGGEMVE